MYRFVFLLPMFRRHYLCITLFLPSVFFSSILGATTSSEFDTLCPLRSGIDIIGVALSPKTKKFLYCEYHSNGSASQKTLVEYVDRQQQVFARKTIDYQYSLLAPNIQQTDFRLGEERSILRSSKPNVFDLRYLLPESTGVGSPQRKEKQLTVRPPLVIDAGFDKAIQAQFDELLEGRKQKYAFILMPGFRAVDLTVRLTKKKRCKGEPYDKLTQVCLYVEPANIVLSWLVKPIGLVYERSSKHLMTFSGQTNLLADDGKQQKALIHYRYIN